MDQNFASPAVATLPLQRPAINGHVVVQAILHLQKLNGCSVNKLKKYLASQHGIDGQALDVAIKPIMKMAMDRNILKKLGHTVKVTECKKNGNASRKVNTSKGPKGIHKKNCPSARKLKKIKKMKGSELRYRNELLSHLNGGDPEGSTKHMIKSKMDKKFFNPNEVDKALEILMNNGKVLQCGRRFVSVENPTRLLPTRKANNLKDILKEKGSMGASYKELKSAIRPKDEASLRGHLVYLYQLEFLTQRVADLRFYTLQ
ncbi:hypothetical protein AVEN_198611-1 [Araneus ventricosus]|uniref:H15 domain-containing protein n=1 Tax=Araneus ventricosus TaxID=182803 RepID=A0A4Y2NT61_ARAVE|nr:hypothetical protein AVEN_198611-1 [Araneus ventricosus]